MVDKLSNDLQPSKMAKNCSKGSKKVKVGLGLKLYKNIQTGPKWSNMV